MHRVATARRWVRSWSASVAVLVKEHLRDRRHPTQRALRKLPIGIDRWPRLTVLVALHQEHVDLFRFHSTPPRPRESATAPTVCAVAPAHSRGASGADARPCGRSKGGGKTCGSRCTRRVEPYELGARHRPTVATADGLMR